MRNEEKKNALAIGTELSLPVAHRTRGHQGPPLADVLAELGYDDVWTPLGATDSRWPATLVPEAEEIRLSLYALGRGFDCML